MRKSLPSSALTGNFSFMVDNSSLMHLLVDFNQISVLEDNEVVFISVFRQQIHYFCNFKLKLELSERVRNSVLLS